ncbi:multiprotein-bridging factor 1 family protein [Chloroflexota bacterium]
MTEFTLDKCHNICYRILHMSKLVDKIRQCRDLKGWTQEQLARNVGVSLNTVQRWESGRTQPSPLAMEKLQEVLEGVLDGDQLRLLLE